MKIFSAFIFAGKKLTGFWITGFSLGSNWIITRQTLRCIAFLQFSLSKETSRGEICHDRFSERKHIAFKVSHFFELDLSMENYLKSKNNFGFFYKHPQRNFHRLFFLPLFRLSFVACALALHCISRRSLIMMFWL